MKAKFLNSIAKSEHKYYHTTMTRNVPRILREGLIPRRGTRARGAGETQAGVYLFPDLTTCDEAVCNWLGEQFSESTKLTTLEVTLPEGAQILPSPVEYEVIVGNRIPPENIKVFRDEG